MRITAHCSSIRPHNLTFSVARSPDIRRSQCGNSEAIVGGWVGTSTNNASEKSQDFTSAIFLPFNFLRNTQSRSFTYSKDSNQHRVYTYVAVSGAVLYRGDIILLSRHLNAGGEAVSKRKPRSERRGWEISFKQALLLRAEGGIRLFFVGHCRGDIASGVRNDTTPRH